MNILVDLRLDERPWHLEALRLLCLVSIPETDDIVNTGGSKCILLGYVDRDDVLLVTALALQKLHIAAALAHLRLLEESHTALPATRNEPKIAVVREELKFTDLAVHDHGVFRFVENKGAGVQVVDLDFPAFESHNDMFKVGVYLAGGQFFLVVILRGKDLVDWVTADAVTTIHRPDTDKSV